MTFPAPRLWRGVFSLCALMVLGACDDDPTTPSDDAFDPAFAEEALAEITSVLEAAELEAIVGMISFTLAQGEGPAAAPASLRAPWTALSFTPAARAVAPALGAGLAASSMPSQYLGKTLVFDEQDRLYIVDPDRTGAPATGVRFVTYAMDLDAGSPIVPLTEIGYVDVSIQSENESSLVLELSLVSTAGQAPVTLADYTMAFEATDDASGTGISLQAAGFASDGTERVDFEVGVAFQFPATGDAGTFEHSVAFDVVGTGIGFEQTLDLAFDPSTFEAIGDASYVNTVTNGGETLVLDLAIDEDDALIGVVERNGVVVLTVGGMYESPTFQLPLGGSPPEATRAAMLDLWTGIELAGDAGIRMMGPMDALAAY